MKFALICPNEIVPGGHRIAQVEANQFPVGEPTYWLECSDDVVAGFWYFDTTTNVPTPIPVEPSSFGLQAP